MQLITEKGIELLESSLPHSRVSSDRYSTQIKIFFDSLIHLFEAKAICEDKDIKVKLEGKNMLVNQDDISKLIDNKEAFVEERVWGFSKNKLMPTNAMDHQHLSNCVGLLEVLITKDKISKQDADNYLIQLKESIIPELEERFNGKILPYKPYYDWERKLAS